MTAALDTFSTTVGRLVESCHRSQRGFQAAAEAAKSQELKRLLHLYSHQRTRFAGELQAECRNVAERTFSSVDGVTLDFGGKTDPEILDRCLETDADCLQAYAQALKERVPGRAHFLIAAQYSLLQQVHERMRSLAQRLDQPRITSISHCL